MEQKIKELADSFISTASRDLGVILTYDRASVAWTDEFIEGLRSTLDDSLINGLSLSVGAFLGECIRVVYGGEWRRDEDDQWGVYFDDKNAAFPFAKVHKQFLNGKEDSILSFFEIIPIIFSESHDT